MPSDVLPLVSAGVSKVYPGAPAAAVQDLTLTVAHGEIVTVLGPSGCGKTTSLRLIAGLERPDGGEIRIQGRLVCGWGTWVPPEQRGIGMVFQDYALFPHLTVAENIAFGLLRVSREERRSRVRSTLRLVGLQGLEDRYPHHLSGGQQQRVALARALAPRPGLVLLDEPFSNLDAALRVQMREEVRRILKTHGCAAIIVTHDQKDALAISDRVAVMNQGRVEQIDDPFAIYQSPRTAFVARFVGQTNLLPGVISPRDERVIETGLGPIPCRHSRGLPAGTPCVVSVRPDSFDVDPRGAMAGVVKRIVYSGNVMEVLVEVVGQGAGTPLLIHAHPSHPHEQVAEGQLVRFRPKPDFVSVIEGPTVCAEVAGVEGYRLPDAAAQQA